MRAVDPFLTADEFLDARFDMPESGQWSELVRGEPIHLQPPDLDHGNTILNLSKQLAEFASRSEGYPCFDLGLLLERAPDTVWFPAVCFIAGGPRFAETDRVITDTVPAAVIELASTADRRKRMSTRTERYFAWGVETVWVIDPAEQTLEMIPAKAPRASTCLGVGDRGVGVGCFSGLEVVVSDLFTEPSWWS